jgi:hypothetical protein
MCGAQTIALLAKGSNVKVNNLTPDVVGDADNHNMLGQLINVIPHNVNVGGITAIPSIISMASPDVMGLVPHPQGLPIPVQGSPNVFIGQGTGAAGIGMMQPILGGLGGVIGFNPLQIGELVSVAGQVIGMVMNFTQIGGGAAVAQLTNLRGNPITSGTTVTGQTSGYRFTFSNYFDSRTYDNVPGGASYNVANSYMSVGVYAASANVIINDIGTDYDYILSDNFSETYVMDDGEIVVSDIIDPTASYIVISDYDTYSPALNLTSATIISDPV